MSVEDRIVSMKFDNSSFQRGVADTLSTLDKLKQALNFGDSKDSMKDLSRSMNEFDGSRMADAVENISSKFSALGAIGFAVIQRLTNAGLDFAKSAVKNVIDPILEGGKRRAVNMEQAKFMLSGAGLDVEKTMDSALKAVEGTSYGLDAAAKAAGQFGASGIEAGDQMTKSLRAIAGVAAMTNTSYEEMSDIFTTAAGKGVVGNMELMRISQRGLNVTAKLGEQLGITQEEVKELAREGKLSFEDFAQHMDDAFGEHATKANETYTGSLANLKTAMGRVGNLYYTPQLEQQRLLFVSLAGVIKKLQVGLEPLINVFVQLRRISNESLVSFLDNFDASNINQALDTLAHAMVHVYVAAQQFLGIVRDAFREVFPPSQGSIIIKIADAILKFSESLKMGEGTANSVKNVFKGLFSIFKIGFAIIGVVAKLVMHLGKTLLSLLGPATSVAGGIGELIFKFQDMLLEGGALERFFIKVHNAISALGRQLITAKTWLQDLFSDGIPGAALVTKGLDAIKNAFSSVESEGSKTAGFIGRLKDVFGAIGGFFVRVGGMVRSGISSLWSAIGAIWKDIAGGASEVFSGDNFLPAMGVASVGALAAVGAMLARVIKNFRLDLGQLGFMDAIKETFSQLTDTLSTMQAAIKSEIIMKIAKALALLTASVVVLSFIDPGKIASSLAALAAGLGGLTLAMDKMIAMSKLVNPATLAAIGTSLVLLAGAALALSLAMLVLARLSWEDLAKGLLTLGIMVQGLSTVMQGLAANQAGMIKAAFSLVVFSIAVSAMAAAVALFAMMEWETLIRGLAGAGAAVGLLVVAINYIKPDQINKVGFGLLLFSFALKGMESAIQGFAAMDMGSLVKGLAGFGLTLAMVVIALQSLPTNMQDKAVGMLIMAGAILIMGQAVKMIGSLPFGDLVKGLLGMGLTLGMLVIAANALTGAVAGAANMIIMAGAMVIMSKALQMLGQLSIGQIVTGLLAMVGVLVIFGLSALVLAPIIPVLALLGVSLALLGAGFMMFSMGALLAVKAFALLAAVGVAGTAALIASLFMLAKALPGIISTFISGLGGVISALVGLIPQFVGAIGTMLTSVLELIRTLVPEIVETLGTILIGIMDLIRTNVPEFIKLGVEILIAFLTSIRDNMFEIVILAAEIMESFINGITEKVPDLAAAVTNLIVTFINTIAANLGSIIAAGVNLLVSFINGISATIGQIAGAVANLIITFITSVGTHMGRVVSTAVDMLVQFIAGISNNVSKIVAAVTALVTEFIDAVSDSANRFILSGTNAIIKFINGMAESSVRITNAIGRAILSVINGIRSAIDKYAPQIRDAGVKLAGSLLDGMTGGLASKAGGFLSGLRDLGGRAVSTVGNAIGSNSPAKKFIPLGASIPEGIVVGINKKSSYLDNSLSKMGRSMVESMSKALEGLESTDEFNPQIRPVLDLDGVMKDAKAINSLLPDPTMSTSYQNAVSISNSQGPSSSQPEQVVDNRPSETTFIQNNYSPEALSVADIYRNTKSQFAMAKEELEIA